MLAGYISANRVDLARVDKNKDGIVLYDHARYTSRDFKSLEGVLNLYVKKFTPEIGRVCLGVAGPVIRDEVRPTNLPWHIKADDIREQFGFVKLKLVNDIVATAHGLSHLSEDKLFVINEGRNPNGGNLGLIAAGSGLGQAIIYRKGDQFYPYASEGGHANFGPGSQVEAELWEFLYAEKGHVEAEDVISWTGLETIYNFVTETQGYQKADWYRAARYPGDSIIEKALSGEDEAAIQTMEMFIDCYASEAGNLALNGMTLGGIYIGGQIAPRIITALDKGRFMRRFVKRGKMEAMLEQMPVRLIIDDRTALIGAASIAKGL